MTSETATDRDEPQELIQHFEMRTLTHYTSYIIVIKFMNNIRCRRCFYFRSLIYAYSAMYLHEYILRAMRFIIHRYTLYICCVLYIKYIFLCDVSCQNHTLHIFILFFSYSKTFILCTPIYVYVFLI
jgi:hypothetical protein